MADIVPTQSLSISEQLSNLELVKYHPSGILQLSLNRLTDMLAGKVEIVDPSNPFVYLLETSSLNTAFAVQEHTLLTRKLYPRLANSEDDLYLHMSDYDFLGRFSTPSYANVVFNILFNDFKTKAKYNSVQKEYVLKLPRHLKITIGKYRYLLTSAIIIRQTENDVIDVKFENQDFNNMFPITTNYINFAVNKVNQEETYLSFILKLPEIDIDVYDIAADLTSACKGELTFNPDRMFYFARVFHYKDDKWNEMLVTHTNDVYDITKPTCVIKVLVDDKKVKYHIPAVYTTSGMVSSRLKFLFYTTMGKISVNFGDFQVNEFGTEYGDVFPETELDVYTQPVETITKLIYTTDIVSSGSDGMTFEELKDAVINNSIGDRKLPITSKQLEFATERTNFNIIKDVDVVTNRIYKLETEIPSPATRYPITKFNLDILELQTSISDLRRGNKVISYTSDVTVIPEGTLFRLENGILYHLSNQEVDQLKPLSGVGLVNSVNNTRYLVTYYHYVVDTSDNQIRLRAYDLTTPAVTQVSFQSFNPTTRIGVNTITGNLYRTNAGYTLDVMTNVKQYIDGVTYENVTPYLVYVDNNDSKFYLQGTFLTLSNDVPVYRFVSTSEYYVDSNHQLQLGGFVDNNGLSSLISVGLNPTFQILYTSTVTPPAFELTDIDTYVTGSYLSGLQCGVTLEDISVRFGDHLERLFAGVHTSTGSYNYRRYTDDIVLRYTTTVYNADNQVVHQIGDIVYDEITNEPIIQHAAGSVVIGEDGGPLTIDQLELVRYLNLMLIDYRVLLATSSTISDYNKQIKTHITEVCLEDATYAQSQLLDNTEAFVVVPKTVADLRVKTPSGTNTISSMQSFVVDVFVNFDTYNSTVIRDNISYDVIRMLDEYLYKRTVIKRTEALNTIFTKLKEFVVSVSLSKFTELNEEYMELIDKNSRISLAKTLTLEATGYSLKEDIVVNFRLIE